MHSRGCSLPRLSVVLAGLVAALVVAGSAYDRREPKGDVAKNRNDPHAAPDPASRTGDARPPASPGARSAEIDAGATAVPPPPPAAVIDAWRTAKAIGEISVKGSWRASGFAFLGGVQAQGAHELFLKTRRDGTRYGKLVILETMKVSEVVLPGSVSLAHSADVYGGDAEPARFLLLSDDTFRKLALYDRKEKREAVLTSHFPGQTEWDALAAAPDGSVVAATTGGTPGAPVMVIRQPFGEAKATAVKVHDGLSSQVVVTASGAVFVVGVDDRGAGPDLTTRKVAPSLRVIRPGDPGVKTVLEGGDVPVSLVHHGADEVLFGVQGSVRRVDPALRVTELAACPAGTQVQRIASARQHHLVAVHCSSAQTNQVVVLDARSGSRVWSQEFPAYTLGDDLRFSLDGRILALGLNGSILLFGVGPQLGRGEVTFPQPPGDPGSRPGNPTASLMRPSVQGGLDVDTVRRVAQGHLAEIQACYVDVRLAGQKRRSFAREAPIDWHECFR